LKQNWGARPEPVLRLNKTKKGMRKRKRKKGDDVPCFEGKTLPKKIPSKPSSFKKKTCQRNTGGRVILKFYVWTSRFKQGRERGGRSGEQVRGREGGGEYMA